MIGKLAKPSKIFSLDVEAISRNEIPVDHIHTFESVLDRFQLILRGMKFFSWYNIHHPY